MKKYSKIISVLMALLINISVVTTAMAGPLDYKQSPSFNKFDLYDAKGNAWKTIEGKDVGLSGIIDTGSGNLTNEEKKICEYVTKVMDYYKDNFGITVYSYDKSKKLKVIENVGEGVLVASHKYYLGVLSISNKYAKQILNDCGILAHELTHGVTDRYLNDQVKFEDFLLNDGAIIPVDNYGQTNALKEAISDIMGIIIRGEPDNWRMGEAFGEKNVRDGSVPLSIKDYIVKKNLAVDAHENSKIITHAFYLMHGAVGLQSLGKIIINALQYYIKPNPTFVDFRHAIELSAIDIFGENSKRIPLIRKAFDSVGIVDKYQKIESIKQMDGSSRLALMDKVNVLEPLNGKTHIDDCLTVSNNNMTYSINVEGEKDIVLKNLSNSAYTAAVLSEVEYRDCLKKGSIGTRCYSDNKEIKTTGTGKYYLVFRFKPNYIQERYLDNPKLKVEISIL